MNTAMDSFWIKNALIPGLALAFGMLANVVVAQDKVRIGVWNIEKLSATASRGFPETSGLGPRTETQLDEIASYILNELKVDALMVSEIEADSPASTESVPQSKQLNHIATQLGSNWKYFLGRTGGKLRLGFLFNTERVRLKKLVNLHASEFDVTGRDVFDRDPFIAWIEFVDDAGVTKNDVMLIGIHLKSIQDRFRNNRMAAVAKIVGDITDKEIRNHFSLPSKNEEKETIILGDCNDSSFSSTGFRYMFDYLEGTGFKHVKPDSGVYPDTRINGSKIDHVFGTSKLLSDSLVTNSFQVHTVPAAQRDQYRANFSDHFPVTIDLKLIDDADLTMDEVLLVADAAERGRLLAEMTDDIGELVEGVTEPEDDEPPRTSFDIIEKDFEKILAPQPKSEGTDLAESVSVAEPLENAENLAELSQATTRIAIVAIQKNIDSLLKDSGGMSQADRNLLRELIAAERQFQKQVNEDK